MVVEVVYPASARVSSSPAWAGVAAKAMKPAARAVPRRIEVRKGKFLCVKVQRTENIAYKEFFLGVRLTQIHSKQVPCHPINTLYFIYLGHYIQ